MSTPLDNAPIPSREMKRYGFVGVIVTDRDRHGSRLNQILAAHAGCIVGRLGLPNLEGGAISIVTLIVHATTDELGSLTGKLGALPGVSVKSAMHKVNVPGIDGG